MPERFYIIGFFPPGIHITEAQATKFIREADVCMKSERTYAPGEEFTASGQRYRCVGQELGGKVILVERVS